MKRNSRWDTFWAPHSVHSWRDEEIEKMSESNSDLFSNVLDENTFDFDDIENNLNAFSNPEDIVGYMS